MGTENTPPAKTETPPARKDNAADNITAGLQRVAPEKDLTAKSESTAKPGEPEKGAGTDPAKPPVAEDKGAGTDPAKPPVAEDKGAAKGGENSEVSELRARLAKMESAINTRDQAKAAEDFTDSFIREHAEAFPKEMLRKFLPISADRQMLMREMQKMEGWMKQYVDYFVKKGSIIIPDIGSGGGGMSPAELVNTMMGAGKGGPTDNAHSNIQHALRAQRHPVASSIGAHDYNRGGTHHGL